MSHRSNPMHAATPTEAQKEAGNYRMAHVRIHGLGITIETPKGRRRRPQWPPMACHYGYFKRTEARDGDNVDVFLGPNRDSELVYVIDQMGKSGDRFDESKVLMGFDSQVEAIETYKACYTPDWKVGPVTAMTIGQFKAWLKEGDTMKPIAPQVSKYAANLTALLTPIIERYAGKTQMSFNWDEEAHPRAPKGSDGGGQFVKKEEGKAAASSFDDAHMTKLVRDGSLGMAQESIYDDFRNERIDADEMDKRLAKLPKADAWNDAKKIAGHLGIHANGWSGKVKHYFGRIGEPEFKDGRLVNKISGPNGDIHVQSGDIDLMGPKIQKALKTHRLELKDLGPDIRYFIDELAKEHIASDKNIRDTLVKHGLSEKITESLPVRKLVVDRASELREEAKKPSEARAKAMARFEELNKPKRELKPGYVEQPRAKAGGEVSDVDGKFYKGGALMPVHGAFSGQEKPPAKPKRADGEAMAVKADNEGKGVKAVRERSAEDVAAMKSAQENQHKWDKLKATPLGELFRLGDRPHAIKFGTHIDRFIDYAKALGSDGLSKLADRARDMMRAKYAEKYPKETDEAIAWDDKEYRDDSWWLNRKQKKALGELPDLLRARSWVEQVAKELGPNSLMDLASDSKEKYSVLADLHLPYDPQPYIEQYQARLEKERYEWVESAHPRHEAGAPGGVGGQFAGSNRMGGGAGGGSASAASEPAYINLRHLSTIGGKTFTQENAEIAERGAKVASMPGLAKSSKIRDVASPPSIAREHDLHWSKAGDFSQKIFQWHLDMHRALKDMTLEHTAGADGAERDQKWEQAWQAGDKTRVRELLAQMNAMDKEARAQGINLASIVNANGLIPREVAERLSSGSRFFDPERIRDKIQAGNKKLGKEKIAADAKSKDERVDSMLNVQPVPESAKIPGVMFTGQKSMAPKPLPAPRREESDPAPTAEPEHAAQVTAAIESVFSKLPKQSQKKIDEAIRGIDEDMPSDMAVDLRDTVMETWKTAMQEAQDHNAALREVMGQSGKNWGTMSARLAKGADYDKIKGFDQLAEYAAAHYPQLLNQARGESDSGSNEEALAKTLRQGVRDIPQPWHPEVIDRVREQVSAALAAASRGPIEIDESVPFSIRDLVEKFRYALQAA